MSDVIHLFGGETPAPKVNPATIALLHDALDAAHKGLITDVVLLQQVDGGVRYDTSGGFDRFRLMGWLTHTIHRLQSDE